MKGTLRLQLPLSLLRSLVQSHRQLAQDLMPLLRLLALMLLPAPLPQMLGNLGLQRLALLREGRCYGFCGEVDLGFGLPCDYGLACFKMLIAQPLHSSSWLLHSQSGWVPQTQLVLAKHLLSFHLNESIPLLKSDKCLTLLYRTKSLAWPH